MLQAHVRKTSLISKLCEPDDKASDTRHRLWVNEPDRPLILHARVVTGCGGGPDKTVLRSARYAHAAGYAMGAVYIYPQNDAGIQVIRDQARELRCPLWEMPESGPIDPRTVATLVTLCRKLRVSIWHGHDYKTNFLGLVLRRFWPMKLVSTVHGWTWDTARIRLYYHIDLWSLKKYDYVLAVNKELVEHCINHGVARDRLSHIANGIEAEQYQPTADISVARSYHSVGRDRLVVGVVGRLSLEKGVDRAIHLLKQMRDRYPSVELHIVGDGPEREKLKALVRDLGVDAHVRFWGWQADARQFYQMMDVLLLPSRTEASPNVVYEAMAMGVPVAAADVGCVRHLLDSGRCGVILPADNPSVWLRQMAFLLTNASYRDALKQNARLRIVQQFSFQQRMNKVFAIYNQLLPDVAVPKSQPVHQAA